MTWGVHHFPRYFFPSLIYCLLLDVGEGNLLESHLLQCNAPDPVGFVYSLEVLTQALEMRENFQRQLQEIMSATSIVRPQGQRGSLSRSSFDGSPTTPDGTRPMRNGRSRVLEALRYWLAFWSTLFCPLYSFSDSHWNMSRSAGFSDVSFYWCTSVDSFVIQSLTRPARQTQNILLILRLPVSGSVSLFKQ